MSIAIMNQVWQLAIPSGRKIVLLSLADQANDHGVCWPSMAKIAVRCSITERSVRSHVAEMELSGLLRRDVIAGRGTVYHINIGGNAGTFDPFGSKKTEPCEQDTQEKFSSHPGNGFLPTPEKFSSLPRKNFPPTPETVSGNPGNGFRQIINNHQEPSNTDTSEPDDSDLPATEQRQNNVVQIDSAKPQIPYQQIVDAYHEALPELPRAVAMSDSRKRLIKSRWLEMLKSKRPDGTRRYTDIESGIAWWGLFFKIAGTNSFWMGENNRGWTANFDWLMKNNWKVVEHTPKESA